MRIAIDYTAAARQGAGIGRYARELVTHILGQQSSHAFKLMTAVAGLGEAWRADKQRLRAQCAAKALTFRDIPLTDNWLARLWQRLHVPLPANFITGPIDLFYSPDFVLPPLSSRTHSILTVHDLSFLRLPETFPPALRAYLERAVPRSVARADHILADSDATRQDLIEFLGVPSHKITTLYCGVSPKFTPDAVSGERKRLQDKYGIGAHPYILAVGTVQPRKNYPRLMEACDPLAESGPIELVIVGKAAWLAEPSLAAAESRDYVHLLGFLEDEDLPALYRQASVFAFPSLYEGFGIPPLEAMGCGTPVVASTASSLPEVVGAAGLLVSPGNVPAWTAALQQLLRDKALCAQLREAGFHQVKKFTWAKAACQWLSLVARVFATQDL